MTTEKKRKKTFVIDASAIFNGILSHNLHGKKYLPQCVTYGIEGMHRGEALLEEITVKKDVVVTIPDKTAYAEVSIQANETGDIAELSECDMSVVALAYELKSKNNLVEIITDDYDIQNLANHMGIPYKGIYWKGITWVHDYTWVCTGCGFKSKKQMDTCFECGSSMKKKVHRKKKRS